MTEQEKKEFEEDVAKGTEFFKSEFNKLNTQEEKKSYVLFLSDKVLEMLQNSTPEQKKQISQILLEQNNLNK